MYEFGLNIFPSFLFKGPLKSLGFKGPELFFSEFRIDNELA